MLEQPCPCGSTLNYAACCAPLHQGALPVSAEALMRSRYCAFVLQKIDYIIATTVPLQQPLLDRTAIAEWAAHTHWLGLQVLRHVAHIGKTHAQVEFNAYFQAGLTKEAHHELSTFVKIGEGWFFLDPTVPLPTMKSACLCGSGKKFKACCGSFFR